MHLLHCLLLLALDAVSRLAADTGGRLGEWFELDRSPRDDSRSDSGLLIGDTGMRNDQHRIRVKVEEIKWGARARIR